MKKDNEHLLASGHYFCPGCGEALAIRLVLRASGPNVIVTNPTGCAEVCTSNYPYSAWEVPWVHSLFENHAAVASGIEAALRYLGKIDKVRVIAHGGDGGTADIGFQALSGMFERGHDILCVCYDNEAYMNTGIQRSGTTPLAARTTTTPPGRVWMGNWRPKKDMPMLALAHYIPYVATTSVGYPFDLDKKVKKAHSIRGPKYIHILTPCPLGWAFDPSLTIEIARLATETGLFPLYEYENGKLISVRKIARRKPVEEYLRLQGRFSHLFEREEGKEIIAQIQAIADQNIERFGLLEK